MNDTPSPSEDNPAASLARRIGLVAGPLLALLLCVFADLDPEHPAATRAAAVAVWMAVWWMTEAVPMAATSLLPLALFPLLGVIGAEQTATQYASDTIFLFLGGFLIALAMERWRLHERIALRILILAGTHPAGILAGFSVATAFLSMWISNTATAMMMAPIALALVSKLETEAGKVRTAAFASAVLLAVAYSASIGGMATLVGTPTNMVFVRAWGIAEPDKPPVTFAQWMFVVAPMALVMLVAMWAWLAWKTRKATAGIALDPQIVRTRLADLGRIGREEATVLAVGTLTALLWIFRAPIPVGSFTVPGWSEASFPEFLAPHLTGRLFPDSKYITDGFVAMAMALLLFVIPAKGNGSRRFVLEGDVFKHLPWGIVLLFGGGFALAAGIKDSGLSEWIGQQFQNLAGLPPFLILAIVCLAVAFLTELTSNTATANILLPLLAALGAATGTDPLMLMVSGTVACSLGFMLPVGTPPNAIVMGTERVPLRDMLSAGFFLDVAGAAVVAALAWTLVPLVMR